MVLWNARYLESSFLLLPLAFDLSDLGPNLQWFFPAHRVLDLYFAECPRHRLRHQVEDPPLARLARSRHPQRLRICEK